jgi:hypothetical protein
MTRGRHVCASNLNPQCTCDIPETRLHLVETRRVADVLMSTLSRYLFLAEDPRLH